jgi:outer membrane lipoprotein
MKNISRSCFFPLLMLPLLLAACASPISPEMRREAADNLAFAKVLADTGAYRGAVVVWGGIIAATVTHENGTDLYVTETPLDFWQQPAGLEHSEGEFVAKTSQILDKKEYRDGRKVTVAGTVVGQELGTYHNAPYAYPVIRIKEIHLWAEPRPLKWDWWNIPPYSAYPSAPQQYRQQMPYR